MSVSVSYDPTPKTPFGFTARVSPAWGGDAMNGGNALWVRQTRGGMGMAGGSTLPGGGKRLDTEMGYGLPISSRFVGTARIGVRNSEYGRDYRLGYGLEPGVDRHAPGPRAHHRGRPAARPRGRRERGGPRRRRRPRLHGRRERPEHRSARADARRPPSGRLRRAEPVGSRQLRPVAGDASGADGASSAGLGRRNRNKRRSPVGHRQHRSNWRPPRGNATGQRLETEVGYGFPIGRRGSSGRRASASGPPNTAGTTACGYTHGRARSQGAAAADRHRGRAAADALVAAAEPGRRPRAARRRTSHSRVVAPPRDRARPAPKRGPPFRCSVRPRENRGWATVPATGPV